MTDLSKLTDRELMDNCWRPVACSVPNWPSTVNALRADYVRELCRRVIASKTETRKLICLDCKTEFSGRPDCPKCGNTCCSRLKNENDDLQSRIDKLKTAGQSLSAQVKSGEFRDKVSKLPGSKESDIPSHLRSHLAKHSYTHVGLALDGMHHYISDHGHEVHLDADPKSYWYHNGDEGKGHEDLKLRLDATHAKLESQEFTFPSSFPSQQDSSSSNSPLTTASAPRRNKALPSMKSFASASTMSKVLKPANSVSAGTPFKVEAAQIISAVAEDGNRKVNIAEIIRKVSSGYQLKSHKGRNLGTYNSRAGAEKRERQVNFFKNR